jgi:hypothetical protein
MHSTQYTRFAQFADEASQVIVSVVEDVAANAVDDSRIVGACILHTPAEGEGDTRQAARFTFARFAITEDEVILAGEQNVHGNLSKAFKYLADYTLDRRPYVHLESGIEVESTDGEKSGIAA